MQETVPARKTVLSFLAHPDDAEILCAGTLIRLADAGWEVHIATATPGDCGSSTLPPEEIAAIRREEGATAARQIGATYHCLEERDALVIYDKPTIRKAIDLFREVAPTLVFTHARDDYMLDHEQVHLLARCATFGYPIPNTSSLQMVDGSTIPWLYYCDPVEGNNPYTGKPVLPSTHVDISDVMDRKVDMLASHASQREWLRAHHGMDEYIDAMKRHSSMRGKEIGTTYAEAFVQHPGHPYPQTNLLKEIVGG